jgi:hypothetical protein
MFHRQGFPRRRISGFLDIAGWYGVLAILGSYTLLNFGFLTVESAAYLLLNVTGASALGAEAFDRKDYQPGVLNVAWAAIALLGVLRSLWAGALQF